MKYRRRKQKVEGVPRKKRGTRLMNPSPHLHPEKIQCVEAVVKHLFPSRETQVERVLSGISTYVYRIISHTNPRSVIE